MNPFIGGIVPAMVTPLTKERDIDVAGAQRFVDFLVGQEIDGLFVLGSGGEYQALAREKRRDLVMTVVERVNGKVPVYAGGSSTSLEETLQNVDTLASWGVDVAVVLPPSFLNYSEEEVFEFYRQVAEHSSLPLVVYNIPSRAKVNLSPDTLARLAAIDNIVGLKDTSGDMDRMTRLLLDQRLTGLKLFQGSDELLGISLLLGAQGGINTVSNVLPKVLVQMNQAAGQKDIERIKELQQIVNRWVNLVRSLGADASINSFLRCAKIIGNLLGLYEPWLVQLDRGPLDSEVKAIEAFMKELPEYFA